SSSCQTLFWKSVPVMFSRSSKAVRLHAKYSFNCSTAGLKQSGIAADGSTVLAFKTETAVKPLSSPLMEVIPSGVEMIASCMAIATIRFKDKQSGCIAHIEEIIHSCFLHILPYICP